MTHYPEYNANGGYMTHATKSAELAREFGEDTRPQLSQSELDTIHADRARAVARDHLNNPNTSEERRQRLTNALKDDNPESCFNPRIDPAQEIARLKRNIKTARADIKRTRRYSAKARLSPLSRQQCEDNVNRSLICIDNMNQAIDLIMLLEWL